MAKQKTCTVSWKVYKDSPTEQLNFIHCSADQSVKACKLLLSSLMRDFIGQIPETQNLHFIHTNIHITCFVSLKQIKILFPLWAAEYQFSGSQHCPIWQVRKTWCTAEECSTHFPVLSQLQCSSRSFRERHLVLNHNLTCWKSIFLIPAN